MRILGFIGNITLLARPLPIVAEVSFVKVSAEVGRGLFGYIGLIGRGARLSESMVRNGGEPYQKEYEARKGWSNDNNN
ncbi:hypothetical protein [Paenibacillus senegalimassiliensis]|uniref:hypothetical protein n=1 Tax=Paenibacillus senegalimassiliensis TaxID=1737426 RepID=UPI00073EF5AA|nr:hypothetical protein [Paenibacillus senegalimassiliensis]